MLDLPTLCKYPYHLIKNVDVKKISLHSVNAFEYVLFEFHSPLIVEVKYHSIFESINVFHSYDVTVNLIEGLPYQATDDNYSTTCYTTTPISYKHDCFNQAIIIESFKFITEYIDKYYKGHDQSLDIFYEYFLGKF